MQSPMTFADCAGRSPSASLRSVPPLPVALAAARLPARAPAASTQPVAPEAAAIRKALEQKFPGAQVRHIAKTAYFGLYEAMLDDQLVYTDPKVAYLFIGSMYDTATKRT